MGPISIFSHVIVAGGIGEQNKELIYLGHMGLVRRELPQLRH